MHVFYHMVSHGQDAITSMDIRQRNTLLTTPIQLLHAYTRYTVISHNITSKPVQNQTQPPKKEINEQK